MILVNNNTPYNSWDEIECFASILSVDNLIESVLIHEEYERRVLYSMASIMILNGDCNESSLSKLMNTVDIEDKEHLESKIEQYNYFKNKHNNTESGDLVLSPSFFEKDLDCSHLLLKKLRTLQNKDKPSNETN